MINIARLPSEDRRELFRNTSDKTGLQDAIIEKDFWVCYTLDYLFHRSPWKEALCFKGGTSLSKAFGAIQRFSEDIDLILDWRELGFKMMEPWDQRSNTKQDAFNKEANARAVKFIKEKFLPTMKNDLFVELGSKIDLAIDASDGQTVLFSYPNLFIHSSTLQLIRLEIGALAAWTPAVSVGITSYAAEQYPTLFEQSSTAVLTVAPERTFWEKATILHHEANRPESLVMPSRYSRHYYDLYQLSRTTIKDFAKAQPEMLRKVVAFKRKFYPRAWAKYEEILEGGLKLVPPENRLDALGADYVSMKDMLFGDVPDFSEIITGLKRLQTELTEI